MSQGSLSSDSRERIKKSTSQSQNPSELTIKFILMATTMKWKKLRKNIVPVNEMNWRLISVFWDAMPCSL
jgi:hypothetical protein